MGAGRQEPPPASAKSVRKRNWRSYERRGESMTQLDLTRERQKDQTIENLINAGVLPRGEAARYGKVLDSFNDVQLIRVWLLSEMYRQESGEIISQR